VEWAQTASNFFIGKYVLRKSGRFASAGNFLRQIRHDLFRDIETPVIKRAVIALDTGVVVAGIEEEDVAFPDSVFLVFAGQNPLSVLHKPDYIIFVKMVWEGLYDSFKPVRLKMKLVVVDDRPCFLFHVSSLRSHYTSRERRRLVKYLHFRLVEIFLFICYTGSYRYLFKEAEKEKDNEGN